MSQPGEQILKIHILSNISPSKNNQIMKFGQLIIEYNIRNIFIEKSYTKYGGGTFPGLSGSMVFIVWQVGGYRNILKLNCKPLAFTSYKAFLKIKIGLELVSQLHFLHDI